MVVQKYFSGSSMYKKPIIKIKNNFSGKYLTASGAADVQHLEDSGDDSQHWTWNHGLVPVSNPTMNIDVDDSVTLAPSDSKSKSQFLILKNGKIVNPHMNLTLGANKDAIQSYQEMLDNTWSAQYVGVDTTELSFERFTPEIKPNVGTWPFDCQNILACKIMPGQACGCKDSVNEKRGVTYFLGAGSKLDLNLDFQSCEELKSHGVDISGYFMINGISTYCHTWSKCFDKLFLWTYHLLLVFRC